jgi:hypothetical protein
VPAGIIAWFEIEPGEFVILSAGAWMLCPSENFVAYTSTGYMYMNE